MEIYSWANATARGWDWNYGPKWYGFLAVHNWRRIVLQHPHRRHWYIVFGPLTFMAHGVR